MRKIIFIIIMLCAMPAYAWTDNEIAGAIYKAENSKSHPYGIMAHYKHTSARQACLNTIAHARRDFKSGDFIEFLGSRYCPVSAHPLNKNWVKNVKYFLIQAQNKA